MLTYEDCVIFFGTYRHNGIKPSAATMANKRYYLKSIFGYLYKHGYVKYNPMEKTDPIRCDVKIKPVFSDTDIEVMKVAIEKNFSRTKKRELMMIMFLLDTGVRISELTKITLNNIDWNENSCIIFGKGRKERVVYFSDLNELVRNPIIETYRMIRLKMHFLGNNIKFFILLIQTN